MYRRLFVVALTAIIGISVWAPAHAQGADARSGTARTAVEAQQSADALLAQTGGTSLSIALVDGSRTAWTVTAGRVNAAGTRPDASTRYGIGSVSKMLATIAVMQLVDAGQVSLDNPVTDYLPDFRMASPEYRQITVRMLLNHSAGLPGTDYTNGFTNEPYLHYADQVLAALATQRLKTTPGAMSVYCNDCFTLAGIIVERLSGQSFPDYVAQRILAPLGMQESGYATTQPAPGSYAPVLTSQGTEVPHEVTNVWASGGLVSTPTDMGRLASMLMQGGQVDGVRILSPQSVSAMGTSQLPTTLVGTRPVKLHFGLGWDDVREPGLAAAGLRGWVKAGDTGQYHAAMTLAPDQDMAVLVTGAGTTLGSSLLETLAQEVLLSALAAKGAIDAVPDAVSTKAPARATPSATDLSNISGIYLSQGVAMRVTPRADGGIETATLHDGQWVPLPGAPITMRSDGRFWGATNGSALSVARGWGRTYLVLDKVSTSGRYRQTEVLGQRVTPLGALDPAWAARVGHTWLLANELPNSQTWDTASPVLALSQIPGANGYLWVKDPLSPSAVDGTVDGAHAYMAVVVPQLQGRDLNDLGAIERADGTWLQYGRAIYRPRDSVPALTEGAVTIGSDGYAEWRTIPASATIRVSGPGTWKAYDALGSRLASGSGDGEPVSLPAGSLLALFGAPNAVLEVTDGQ